MDWFKTTSIAFTLLDYPVSYLEFVACLFGLLSVFLAIKENILTWPTGIVNEIGFFILFYQVHLYADMLLQCVFFVVTLYGWRHWHKGRDVAQLHSLGTRRFLILAVIILVTTIGLAMLISQFHTLMPSLFPAPAAHPFIDSLIAVTSVAAITLLAIKAVESWLLWIFVDFLSIGLFIAQDIYVVAGQYALFLVMASAGFYRWRRALVQ